MLVLGEAMADWLAYGLEDAYAEQPDMGVIRKHKTVSGLIKYQPKGEPADWAAAAKGILATEKPDAIVVMLGLNDRVAMREAVDRKPADKKADKKDAAPSRRCQAGEAKLDGSQARSGKPADKTEGQGRVDKPNYASRDEADNNDTPAITGRERARSPRRSTNSARSAGSNSTPRRSRR